MNILYRRFLLVTALIAAFGVLTANLILETRRVPTGMEALSPAIMMPCELRQHCALGSSIRFTALFSARG